VLSAENLASIEEDGADLGRLVREHPDRPVPQYPGWLLSDLAQHVAWAQGRVVTICQERATDRIKGPRLPEGMDPADWYDETLGKLLDTLRSSDPETPVWGLGEMATIGFWERRMVIETAVHLWDARQAVGAETGVGTHAALAGLEEYQERVPFLGDLPALAVEPTDADRSWMFGVGDPVATLSGTASDILLRLYSRPSPVVLPDAWANTLDSLPPPPKP
jgi:uncharacterized protein (TIGR03083 family)